MVAGAELGFCGKMLAVGVWESGEMVARERVAESDLESGSGTSLRDIGWMKALSGQPIESHRLVPFLTHLLMCSCCSRVSSPRTSIPVRYTNVTLNSRKWLGWRSNTNFKTVSQILYVSINTCIPTIGKSQVSSFNVKKTATENWNACSL